VLRYEGEELVGGEEPLRELERTLRIGGCKLPTYRHLHFCILNCDLMLNDATVFPMIFNPINPLAQEAEHATKEIAKLMMELNGRVSTFFANIIEVSPTSVH
jgi:hypothetical protein